MSDATESARRQLQSELNSEVGEGEALAAKYGQVWNTAELSEDFVVSGFMAPFVIVKRKSDGVVGSLEFQHQPRFYFNFSPHTR